MSSLAVLKIWHLFFVAYNATNTNSHIAKFVGYKPYLMPVIPKLHRFPPSNPLTWRPAADALPVQQSYHNFDNALHFDRLWENEHPITYAQPLQHGDTKLRLYVDTTAVSVTYALYDITGAVIAGPQLVTQYTVFAGNTMNGVQLNTFYFNLVVPGSTIEGFVQYQITLTYSNATTDVFLSEPCLLKAGHPNTHFIEYSNNVNDFDIRYEQLNCAFAFRCEGRKPILVVGSDAVVSEGYNKEMTPLKVDNFRSFRFLFGGNKGVPDYVCDKLNRVIGHKNIIIGGEAYAREESTKLEVAEFDNYPLGAVGFQLRELKNTPGVYDKSISTVLTIVTYPSAIPYFSMVNNNFQLVTENIARSFYNQSDLEDYKDYLNATFVLNNFLTGAFTRTGDIIEYTNGPGETYQDAANIVLSSYFTINLLMPATTAWRYYFRFGSYHVTDWGDGSVTAHTNTSNTATTQVSHTYVSATSYTVNIFHNNAMREFWCNEPLHGVRIQDISNSMPSQLEVLDIKSATALASFGVNFDPSFIFPARNTLKRLFLYNCAIDGFNPGLFSLSGWGQLVYCDLRLNSLSAAEVDEIFNNKQQLTTTVAGGQYHTKFQSPAAPPTGASTTSRQIMSVGLACTITTD